MTVPFIYVIVNTQAKWGVHVGVTIADIAKAAGVSTATVERVLHKNGYVSNEARKKVETAIAESEYVPNTMAHALKCKKSGLIGSLVMDNPNNLYNKINDSVYNAAEKRGYQVITIQGRITHRDEARIIDQFIGLRIDGLAVISNIFLTNDMLNKLHSRSIPVVTVERTYGHPYTDNIVVRDAEGVYGAARRFLENGHIRVALIAAAGSGSVEKLRLAGYKKAMAESGAKLMIKLTAGYGIEHGQKAMKELLTSPEIPTGVLCTADTLAAGAMQVIYNAGMRVPEDISVVGYDNVLAAQLAPPVDSVDLDIDTIGNVLFSLLERRMEDPSCPSATEYLDTVFVDRGTIRRLP